MPLEPVGRKRLYEHIVDQIMRAVASQELKPGDRLPPERELAESLGVSRSALREAITTLVAAGILEAKHGSGVYVAQSCDAAWVRPMALLLLQQHSSLLDLLEVRKALEGEAAYLAALRATPEDIVSLEKAFAALKGAVEQGHLGAEEDLHFHLCIAQATRNAFFLRVIGSLTDAFLEGLRSSRSMSLRMPGFPWVVLDEHRLILEAVKARDPEASRRAMCSHLDSVRKKIISVRRTEVSGGERLTAVEANEREDFAVLQKNSG